MSKMETGNFFDDIPSNIKEELIQIIAGSSNVRIERIISKGQSSPKDFWYDQNENEWVIVLKGKAKISIENYDSALILSEGSYVNIPAHTKHRVEWTEPDVETIWLAVFY